MTKKGKLLFPEGVVAQWRALWREGEPVYTNDQNFVSKLHLEPFSVIVASREVIPGGLGVIVWQEEGEYFVYRN